MRQTRKLNTHQIV